MDHRATIHEGKLLPTWIYLTTLRASLPRRRLARWVLTSLVGPAWWEVWEACVPAAEWDWGREYLSIEQSSTDPSIS